MQATSLPVLPAPLPLRNTVAPAPPSRASPSRSRTALPPRFTSRDSVELLAASPPQRRHHAGANPERFTASIEPESINVVLDKSISALRASHTRIVDSFTRIRESEDACAQELTEIHALVATLDVEQQRVAQRASHYITYCAIQIQRVFRGYVDRRAFHQLLALRATLRIQRGFRAVRRRRQLRLAHFRGTSRKILRGVRGIRAKHELSHTELLVRVTHNMQIETQWRAAMGVHDGESSLLDALYRRKFMRRRIGAVFRHIYILLRVVLHWQRLVVVATADAIAMNEGLDGGGDNAEGAIDSGAADSGDDDGADSNAVDATRIDQETRRPQRIDPRRMAAAASPLKPKASAALDRDALRRKQLAYTQRVQSDNARREAARASQIDKQREAARLTDVERARQDAALRAVRLANAQALRDDLERRGLLAARALQVQQSDAHRREEEAYARQLAAKRKIAAQVLSDETQQRLARQQAASATPRKR